MKYSSTTFHKKLSYYLVVFIVLALVISIIIYPGESVNAAYNGLVLWSTLVLPALIPFFIGSELLINLGIVKFIGILLEPIMRPIFNVPGEGSFAFAMSITSGYPVGAKIVAKLRIDNIINQIEAQRLISFCSTSGPLFIIGTVAIGMFQSSEIGIIIAVSHYVSAIIVGFIFSFYRKNNTKNNYKNVNSNIWKRAFDKLSSHINSNYSIGLMLGNAVKDSVSTILMVGGFIILFAVIIKILELIHVLSFLTTILTGILAPFKISPAIISSFIKGIFEMTIGAKSVADSSGINLITKVATVSSIIGWSGLSIHAQISSIIGATDIKVSLYLLSKALHGVLSFLLVYITYPIVNKFTLISSTVYNSYHTMTIYNKILFNFKLSLEFFIGITIGLLILSFIAPFIFGIKRFLFKKIKGMK